MFKLKDFIKRKWWIILIVIVVLNLLSKKSTNPENSSSENHSSSIYSCKDCGAGLGAYGYLSRGSYIYKIFPESSKAICKTCAKRKQDAYNRTIQ